MFTFKLVLEDGTPAKPSGTWPLGQADRTPRTVERSHL